VLVRADGDPGACRDPGLPLARSPALLRLLAGHVGNHRKGRHGADGPQGPQDDIAADSKVAVSEPRPVRRCPDVSSRLNAIDKEG
jgi:hypothetical protein